MTNFVQGSQKLERVSPEVLVAAQPNHSIVCTASMRLLGKAEVLNQNKNLQPAIDLLVSVAKGRGEIINDELVQAASILNFRDAETDKRHINALAGYLKQQLGMNNDPDWIKNFQANNGLKDDGIIGDITAQKMLVELENKGSIKLRWPFCER